ncbi:MAG: hypothetical protein IKK33_04600 [Lachnospiraceae bacterium]|nr:hypothetical protein [Lachnospiraceae bacterium]
MYDYKRYDRSKFITDESEIKIYDECYVPISDENDYDMAIYLEKGALEIDDIGKYKMSLIEHICELDNIVQKYNSIRYPQELDFPYELVNIHIDGYEDMRLEYWGCIVNTQFYVGFKRIENQFILKSFGMVNDIPEDWDK